MKQHIQNQSVRGGAILPHPEVVRKLTAYCRRQWCRTLPQLNQYQRQLATHVLMEYHGFEPREVIPLLGRSRSQFYADLQVIEVYRRTAEFRARAEHMNGFIVSPVNFIY